jgi:hypothetical protein
MSGISKRVVELAAKHGIFSNEAYMEKLEQFASEVYYDGIFSNKAYMEKLEQFASEVYYDGVKSAYNNPVMKCANEIADTFTIGFCNDRMVENFADIIRKYIK